MDKVFFVGALGCTGYGLYSIYNNKASIVKYDYNKLINNDVKNNLIYCSIILGGVGLSYTLYQHKNFLIPNQKLLTIKYS